MSSRSSSRSQSIESNVRNITNEFENDEIINEFVAEKNENAPKELGSITNFKPFSFDEHKSNLSLIQNLPNQQQLNQFFTQICKNRSSDTNNLAHNLYLNEFFSLNQAFSIFNKSNSSGSSNEIGK